MFTIDNYVLAESLDQAYTLNQNKANAILGGILWMKMGSRRIGTAIDLSALGLDAIEEDKENFKIGCMCTLRGMEVHEGLKSYFNGIISKSVENIVGIQFRNCATVGGTIFSRFGFSDLLTALLSLDAYVELHKGGIIALKDFVGMPFDDDILVRIIIKKDNRKAAYRAFRKTATDFPVLTCAVSKNKDQWNIALGARPGKAMITSFTENSEISEQEIFGMIEKTKQTVDFGTNGLGSMEYRQILADVLIRRNIEELIGGEGVYGD